MNRKTEDLKQSNKHNFNGKIVETKKQEPQKEYYEYSEHRSLNDEDLAGNFGVDRLIGISSEKAID